MSFNMNFPGLKGVTIERVDEQKNQIVLHVSLTKKEHTCPSCDALTKKVHDYRMHKIKHLKWFDRLTILFYKCRRYACKCGKRFAEYSPLVIQRFKQVIVEQLPEGIQLPEAIAIDEFKADTDAGTYQSIITNAETHEPIDILPNRK